MTPQLADEALAALAGPDPTAHDTQRALRLLEAAVEQLSGCQLEAVLLANAQPALFRCGMPECLFLLMQLEDFVGMWRMHDADPQAFAQQYGHDLTAEQVNTEIVSLLFRLTTGQHPCSLCLRGQLVDGLASVQAAGHEHVPAARWARDELNKRRLGSVA